MTDISSIASTALIAFQSSLNTISNNISNVNTEGYARQTIEFSTRSATQFGTGYIGNGVQVANITRNADEYVNGVMRDSLSNFTYSEAYAQSASYITDLLADPDTSVDSQIQRFYDELQSLSESPSNGAIREAFFSTADDLSQRFNTAYNQLVDEINNIHDQMSTKVDTVNSIITGIADINSQIIKSPGTPSDLLDTRDVLLKELSEAMNISVLDQGDGTVNVFMGTGQGMVVGTTAISLAVVDNSIDQNKREIAVVENSSNYPVTEFITGGELGGLVQVRDEIYIPAMNKLGRVGISMADAINNQALVGRDLTGTRGTYFFEDVNSTSNIADRVMADSSNIAAATITVSISDTTSLTVSDYSLSFNGGGANYALVRDSDGTTVSSGAIGALPDTIDVATDGFSFTFTTGSTFNDADNYKIVPTRSGASQFDLNITKATQIPLAGAYLTESNAANTSDMTITQPVISPASYTTYNAANPDARTYTVSFPTTSQYRIVDSDGGDTGAVAYTDGMTVTLNNGGTIELAGTPVVGDTFTISPNTASAVGDARNGVLIGDTQTTQIMDSSTLTFQTAFGSMITDMGVKSHQESLSMQSNKAIYEASEQRRNEVSGVNLDEEAANMMRFQQSYQAISQVFRTSTTIFNTFLDAVGG